MRRTRFEPDGSREPKRHGAASAPQQSKDDLARRLAAAQVQAKLTVGAADDPAEREADRAADAVLRQAEPDAEVAADARPSLRPFGAVSRSVPAATDMRGSFDPGVDFTGQVQAQRSGGAPLPERTRQFMETRFAADFSGVRVHTGTNASELNRSISAEAFTHGQDIFLRNSPTSFESPGTKRLLAHELAHTIQQGSAPQIRRKLSPLDRKINNSSRWQDLANLVDAYIASGDSPQLLEQLEGKVTAVLSELEGAANRSNASKAARDRYAACQRLAEALQRERKMEAWLTGQAAGRRNAEPGKLEVDPRFREDLTDMTINAQVSATHHQQLLEFEGVDFDVHEKFGARKTRKELTILVNIPFVGQTQHVPLVQKALDKYWNIFKLTYKSSKGKRQAPPIDKSVKLKFATGKSTMATAERSKAPKKGSKTFSPLAASYKTASYHMDDWANPKAKATPAAGSASAKYSNVPAAKAVGAPAIKKLTWAKGAAKSKFKDKAGAWKEGAQQWGATEGAAVTAPEVDFDALAEHFAVKASNDVFLWTGVHPRWKSRWMDDVNDKKTRSDAGNWRMNDPDVNEMVAHEFGHLIGMPDEYSRSHTDISQVTGSAPLAYHRKTGALRAKHAGGYDAIAKHLANTRASSKSLNALYGTINSLYKADDSKIALFSAHHHKLTGKRLDQELAALEGDYLDKREAIFQQWDVEPDAGQKAVLAADWQKADSAYKAVKDKVQTFLTDDVWMWNAKAGFRSGGIMGDYTTVLSNTADNRANAAAHDHKHPLEPRHVKKFAEVLSKWRNEEWKAEWR